MKIKVTKEDIRNGKRGKCSKCPVALAIGRIFPNERISVTELGIKIGRMLLVIPKRVDCWVGRFDEGNVVDPMTFELAIIP